MTKIDWESPDEPPEQRKLLFVSLADKRVRQGFYSGPKDGFSVYISGIVCAVDHDRVFGWTYFPEPATERVEKAR